MNKQLLSLLGAIALLGVSCSETPVSADAPHYISIEKRADLHAWFRYSPTRPIVISGHRGGMISGYPENCIESFEKTLTMMPSFFEIDPRLTRDSVIVLMHDSKSKTKTVECLPQVIAGYRDAGYAFAPLTPEIKAITFD